jgi:acyl-CoA oxidase
MSGVRIEDSGPKMGLNGVDNGRIWFNQVRIPRENLLDRFAQVSVEGDYSSPIRSEGKRFFSMLGTLVGGRVSVAKAGLSASKSSLAIAIRYGNRRRQFGPKGEPEVALLDYRTHQRRLLPLLANAYALHYALDDLAARFAAEGGGTSSEEVEALASGLKAFGTWNTTRTIQTCRECCGGQGYLSVNRFAALKADTDVFTTFEGDNTVLMLQVAKGLLTDYRQTFQDMNFFGLLKALAHEAGKTLKERNPVVARMTDEAHLRDAGMQVALFQHRERSLLHSVARRLKARIDRGMDSYEAFIECQDHLMALAHAYVERVVLERFVAGVEACEDEALRVVLKQLCDLFALFHIEEDRGWFLEQGYLEAGKAKAIRNQVNALCAELRPVAEGLVDAFAIPEECLAAPIAVKELTANS